MKTCTRCDTPKTIEAFYATKKHSWCKECHRAYARNRLAVRAALINEIKLDAGCSKCGYSRCARALDFHHKDSETKSFMIGESPNRKLQTVLDEIAKCEILCANCHRETHDAGPN